MNKKLVILLVFLITFMTAGCIGNETVNAEEEADLSGTLKLDGSTTVFPIAKHAAEEFMKLHPGVTVDVQQSSSGEGIATFLAGEIDISDATRPPKDKEHDAAKGKGMNLHMTVISNDAVAIIVHPGNPVSDLTVEQLKEIYFDGTINDWSQLTNGEKTGKINVYNTNPEISGTAELFNKKIAGSSGIPYVNGSTIVHPTPDMIPTIKNDPDGIAYTPMKWINSDVKLVTVEGVTPSKQTVLDTSYPLARKMYMITDGSPKDLPREFISYILSQEGQEIVEEEGFIPVS